MSVVCTPGGYFELQRQSIFLTAASTIDIEMEVAKCR
jgi:hypothetical protein